MSSRRCPCTKVSRCRLIRTLEAAEFQFRIQNVCMCASKHHIGIGGSNWFSDTDVGYLIFGCVSNCMKVPKTTGLLPKPTASGGILRGP